MARYLGGLRETIQDHLDLKTIWTLSEAVDLAYKVETRLNRQTPRHLINGDILLKHQIEARTTATTLHPIRDWPTRRSVHDVQSFHGLA